MQNVVVLLFFALHGCSGCVSHSSVAVHPTVAGCFSSANGAVVFLLVGLLAHKVVTGVVRHLFPLGID